MSRPIYRPDYDRVWRAYLTHRRSTHYDKRINFVRRRGWDDPKRFVDCGVCAVMEAQLARAKKRDTSEANPNADLDGNTLPASLRT